ncbi:glycosyl hydrolase family 28-related protein [Peribacillus butanolivorans]|uniref:glycosyl hydrolase family 28-related protein n=1 Tax=Peribacillus butanolivorans TaxID=421767 RepID=UPI0035DAC8D0
MKRRHLLRNIIIILFAFIFGYTVKKEGDSMVLQKVNSTLLKGTDGKMLADKVEVLNKKSIGAINLREFDAVGDGVANDTAAIKKAIGEAIIQNRALYIPKGVYRFISQITIDKNITIYGDGLESCLKPDVGSAVDAIKVNEVMGLDWKDFSILGSSSGCRRGLSLIGVLWSKFKNIHVLCGASEYSIFIQKGWCNEYNFLCSTNLISTYVMKLGFSPAKPQNGHIRCGRNLSTGGLNANQFNCILEGGNGDLLHIENQNTNMTDQGNNYIKGTYEGGMGYALFLEGCSNVVIDKVHLENTRGLLLKNTRNATLTNIFNTDQIKLESCNSTKLDKVTSDSIVIDSLSNFTELGTVFYSSKNGTFTDESKTTFSKGIVTSLSTKKFNKVFNTYIDNANLIQNGDFSRWVSNNPEGWETDEKYGTWTKCGNGLVDTTVNLGKYSAKLENLTSSPKAEYLLNPIYKGYWITLSAWVMIPNVQHMKGVSLQLSHDGGKRVDSLPIETKKGSFFKFSGRFYLDPVFTSWSVGIMGNGVGYFYIADVDCTIGHASPSITKKEINNSFEKMYLDGRLITQGSAIPTRGSYTVGDIVYNTIPVEGGYVGWVCIKAGTPGTWKGFGLIQF